jgi:hypothetical protein
MAGTSGGRTALAVSSAITTALVLVQAILAGRGWFIDHEFIDIHGVVANVVVLAAIAQAVIAVLARRRRQAGRTLVGLSLATLVLVVVQLGLGYAGRDSGTAAALHVPNGVLIFGLAVATTVLTGGRGRSG